MESKKLIDSLLKSGLSIYRIAKDLDVGYQTVWGWSKGFYHPNEKNLQALNELAKKQKETK